MTLTPGILFAISCSEVKLPLDISLLSKVEMEAGWRIIDFGNKDLKPEKSTTYEIGLYYDNADDLRGNITLFKNDFKDKILDTDGSNINRIPAYGGCAGAPSVKNSVFSKISISSSKNPACSFIENRCGERKFCLLAFETIKVVRTSCLLKS